MHSSFTAMIVSCRKYIPVAHSSLPGYTAHLLQSREVFNINRTAIAKQHRRSIIHASKQSYYSSLVTPMCSARRVHSFGRTQRFYLQDRMDGNFCFPAECLYTSSRQHSITTQKSKMLFIPDREDCITNQRTAIRKYPLSYLYDLEQLCPLHMYAYIDTRYRYFYYM